MAVNALLSWNMKISRTHKDIRKAILDIAVNIGKCEISRQITGANRPAIGVN